MTPDNSFCSCRRVVRAVVVLMALGVGGSILAQTPPPRGETERRRGPAGGGQDGERRTFNPADMQARMLAGLRERMGVTSDEEWAVISERIGKVSELRRAAGGGAAGPLAMRGPGGPGGAGGDEGGRGGFRGPMRGGTPEMEALQSAVRDQLPDAEVKARLAKLRDTRKANEKKLEQAQEELRAVLTVRQEALLVMVGLLP